MSVGRISSGVVLMRFSYHRAVDGGVKNTRLMRKCNACVQCVCSTHMCAEDSVFVGLSLEVEFRRWVPAISTQQPCQSSRGNEMSANPAVMPGEL